MPLLTPKEQAELAGRPVDRLAELAAMQLTMTAVVVGTQELMYTEVYSIADTLGALNELAGWTRRLADVVDKLISMEIERYGPQANKRSDPTASDGSISSDGNTDSSSRAASPS